MLLCPYRNGELAFNEGRDRDSNPYTHNTINRDDWDDGWIDARDEHREYCRQESLSLSFFCI